MRHMSVFLFTLVLILLFQSHALSQESVSLKPVSIGAFTGSARESYPELVIINQYPQIYTAVAGDLYLVDKYGTMVDGYVSFIVSKYEYAIEQFLKEARKFALKNSAPLYGVQNLRVEVEYAGKNVILTVTGDIFCGKIK